LYSFLKNIGLWLFPKQWLLENETFLRKVFGAAWKGGTHYCNICETGLSRFVELPTKDLLCPFCGSLPRNRRLWQLLNEKGWLKGRVLDFSPSKCLYRKLDKLSSIEYAPTDFVGEFQYISV